ncbi:SWIM zinc finger domain-containing protein [Burkholderia sp. SIMBA_062]|uniref:SWIM zinc finger family protein n=1 Tax=Burkholderia sp. SIMBA_062 TaxID=3085803 RepID=UPI00397C28A1
MPSHASLADVITLAEIRALADPKSFERGKAYYHDGVVSRLTERDGLVSASVRGTYRYHVELTADDDGTLDYSCNCPVGEDEVFCKHAVAVALSWLENSGEEVFHETEREPSKPRAKRKTHAQRVREYLASLDEHALRHWLLDAAERDRSLRDRLLFEARAANADDVTSLRAAVRQLARVSRPLGWDEAHTYGEGLFELADMLRRQLTGPHAAQVVELTELAIAEAEASLEQIDDSDGSVAPGIGELAALHLDACIRTRPDPVKLAERLFRLQAHGQWDTFRDVLPAYEAPLGDAGLSCYRKRVEEHWAALPPLPPGRDDRRPYDAVRENLEHAMESLAKHDGDVDALIGIWSKDLSGSYRYAQIAELCAAHGRFDEGLAWAERGMREMKDRHDDRLLGFCIDEHVRRRAFDRADELAWQRFAHHPTADAFRALMKVAKATKRCDAVRERAISHLLSLARKREAPAPAATAARRWEPSPRTELVKLLLAEHDAAAAWDIFVGGPVETGVWPTVAAARAKTHPEDAIALYRRYLPFAVDHGAGNARYDEAFGIVRDIRALRIAHRQHAAFDAELDEIRKAYRAKRNFIKLLAKLDA